MTKGDVVGYILLTAFALGWMDLFGNPKMTWWGLIYYVGNL